MIFIYNGLRPWISLSTIAITAIAKADDWWWLQ
jgi:hypothetical protein